MYLFVLLWQIIKNCFTTNDNIYIYIYIYISVIFLDLITVRQSMEKLPNKYHGAKVWNKLPMNNCYLGFFFPLHADIQRQRVWRIWFCSLYNPASPAHKYKAVLCCSHSWDIGDLNQFRFLRRRRRRRRRQIYTISFTFRIRKLQYQLNNA